MPMMSRPRFSHYFASFSILILTLYLYFGNESTASSTTLSSSSFRRTPPTLRSSDFQNANHQLSLFSSLLKRRLVLPNVKKSRMGICYSHPWQTYYDLNAMSLAGVNDSGLQQEKLERWLQGRPEPPRVQRVIIGNSAGPEGGFVGVNSDERNDQKDCLGEKARGNVRFGGWDDALVLRDRVLAAPRSSLRSRGEDEPPTLHQQIVDLLGNSSTFEIFDSEFPHPAGSTGPDILLVDWLSHHPLFSPPSPPSSSPRSLPIEPLNLNSKEPLSASYLEEIGRFSPHLPLAYAPNLVNLASKISEPIHPFLSIHWRTERIPATRLLSCSRTLLNKLEDVLATSRGSGIRAVYLATDLPLQSDDLYKSSTYRAASFDEDEGARDEAVKMLKIAFGRWGKMGRRGVRLTGLREEMSVRGVGEKEKSLAGMDSGVAGILDKLIASHAEIFLSAEDPCGLKSSFTDQIVSLRNRSLATSLSSDLVLEGLFTPGRLPSSSASSSRLRNSVDHFGGREDESSRDREPEEQWILE